MVQIHKTKIYNGLFSYSAWEYTVSIIDGKPTHGTVSYSLEPDTVLGRIGTRQISEELAALPQGLDRYNRVTDHYQQDHERAYAVILAAHPELEDHIQLKSMGHIEATI